MVKVTLTLLLQITFPSSGINLLVIIFINVDLPSPLAPINPTFMNIITSKLMPDEGKVIWSNKVRVGYMDQHAELEKGLTYLLLYS